MLFPKEADKQEGLFTLTEAHLVTESCMQCLLQCKVLSLVIFLSKSRQTSLLVGWVCLSVVIPLCKQLWNWRPWRIVSWCWSLTRPNWGAWTLWFQILDLTSSSSYWHSGLYFFSFCVYHYLGHWGAGSRCGGCLAVDLFGVEWNYRGLCSLKDQTCMKLSRVK